MSHPLPPPPIRWAPRPVQWTPHALERLAERHPETFRGGPRVYNAILLRAQCESWDTGDLAGVGQGVYHDPTSGIRVSVDGHGLVRTVLP